MDDGGGAAAEAPLVPARPAVASVHLKKRALRNKALSVGFDEKHLHDFVGGFHKRKKKRRKIAQRQLLEKERLHRIEARKQRKLEKELALHDGTLPKDASQEETGCADDMEELEDNEQKETVSVSGTKTYQSGGMMITVRTSELSREDEDERLTRSIPTAGMAAATGKQNLCVKKKPLKEVGKKIQHQKPKKHGLQRKVKKSTGRR